MVGVSGLTPEVVVVGGGTAGFAAATWLAERGARVRLLEARREFGGRSRSWVDPAIGAIEDNGQHLLLGCYDEFLAFARRTGGAATIRFEDRLDLTLLEPDGRVARFRPGRCPPPLDLIEGILRLSGFPLAAAAAAAALVEDIRRGGPPPGEMTAAVWLEGHGQGAEARRLLWDPIVLATLNLPPESACASLLVPVVGRALLGGPRAASIGLPRAGLSRLVVDPSVAYLVSRGSEVVPSSPVDSFEMAGDRVAAAVTRAGVRHEAAAFVLAVPHGEAARILPKAAGSFDGERAGRLSASPILAAHLWFDRPVCDTLMAGLLGSPFHWVFDRGRLADDAPSGYLALVASAAADLAARPGDELAAAAVGEVRRYLPRARSAKLLRVRVIKERFATPVFSPQTVGSRPPASTALENLVLAGDWTDTGLPATLEGAAQSGHRAAALARRVVSPS